MVVQNCMPPFSMKRGEFLVLYEIKNENKLVMVLEFKRPRDIEDRTKRRLADAQIRKRIQALRGTLYHIITLLLRC